ncbi:putative transporter [Podospora australis]|uniref:Transporter n=1 Tax=Podospora australis TaxID=1536484 RepID=A0AAN6WJT8_9PEZI|nr:putative transporter [Podospora australis]
MVERVETRSAEGDPDGIVKTESRQPLSDAESGHAKNGLAAHQEVPLTTEEQAAEKKFLFKIDTIILPIIAAIYFLAALDRTDVGNAAVAGMTDQLHLSAAQLSYCVAFFYIGFLIFQLPGSILVRVLTPPIQLGTALVVWGGATAVMTVAQNWQTIAGLRVVVGSFEAFIQGAPLYLTFWYKPHELATRGAIFMSMTNVAGSMNGLIAFAIMRTLDGAHGIPAWRWIFLIEGVVSVGFGFLVFFILPTTPERVKRWFTPSEKEIALRRTREAFNIPDTRPNLGQLKATLRDTKTWFYSVMNGCASISQAAWASFLPVLLKLNGYTASEAQILSIPVYIAAGVSAIAMGYLSDRFRRRGVFVMGAFAVTAAGWLILILSKNKQLSYAGTYFIGIGSSPTVILMLAWMNNNIIGYTKKAGTLAVTSMVGHACAIAVTFSFRDGPNYYLGKGLSGGSAVVAVVTCFFFMRFVDKENARKTAEKDTPEANMARVMSVEEIYDAHPDFVYSK